MLTIVGFRKLAMDYPDVAELPHFHLASFRINKKIFATLHEKDNRAMVRLSLVDQSVFCTYNNTIFYPVPGAWGKKGATFIDLKNAGKRVCKDALQCAYHLAASKK